MKNKTYIKIALDIIMCIVVVLFYNKRVISMKYHEVSGIIVMGLFIIHNGLNFKWIKSVGSKIFSGKLPAKTRVAFIINTLLFILMALVGISGLLISKTVFTSISSSNPIWKLIHMSSAAFALILVGVHLGLHWTYIKSIFKKSIKIPSSIGKPLGVVLMIVILVFGTYSMFNSSFTRWVSMPINLLSSTNQGGAEQGHRETQGANNAGSPNAGEKGGARPQGGQNRQDGNRQKGQGNNQGIDILQVFNVIATFLSITLVFAIIAYNIDKMLSMRKKSLKMIK